jgi:hypothetical protein
MHNSDHAPLIGALLARIFGIEMVLTCFARQNLAIFGDLETLHERFICFYHII